MLSFEEWKAQKKQQEQGGGSAAEAAQETASGTGGKNGVMSFEQWREWKRQQQNETAVPPMPQQSNAQIVAGAREFTQAHQAAQQGKWNQWQTDYQKALAETEAVEETTMPEPVQTETEGREEPAQTGNIESDSMVYTRLAQQAQQTYDAYIQSDEYRDKMYANMAAQGAAMLKASGIHSYTAAGQQTQVQEDQKEKELRAIRDYYRLLAQQAADREVMEADLAEFESWPMEDQLKLKVYIENGMGSINHLLGGSTGSTFARAFTDQQELEEKYGADVVNRIMRSVSRSRNEKLAEEMAIIGKETGKDSPLMGSIATVPMNLIGTVATPVGYLSEAIRGGKGQYHTLDPNNIGNLPNVYTSNVRGQVAENIAGDRYDENGEQISDGGALRQTAAYAYQGLMSSADSLARAALGGGNKVISLGLAATGSFGQTMSEASERGASPAQALLMSVTNGGLEVATEYLPLDEILKVAKGGPVPAKKLLKNIFKQAAIEVTEEEVSYLGSLLAEAVILQEKSGYNQQIAEAVANGASYEDAVEQANRDVIWEAAETAFSSGFSGGISGAVSSTAANISNRGSRKTQEQQPIHSDAHVELADMQVQFEQETWDMCDRIAKATGRNIKLYQHYGPGSSAENGYFQDGVIYVNTRSGDPVAQIISHELTHSVEFAKEYRELSRMVLGRIEAMGGDLKQLRQQKADIYAQEGHPLGSQAEVDQEIVAEFVAKNLLTDEQQIMEVARQNRTLAQKIKGWIEKLLGALGNKDAAERAYLTRVQNLYAKALQQPRSVIKGPQNVTAGAENVGALHAGDGVREVEDADTGDENAEEMDWNDPVQIRTWAQNMYSSGQITDAEFDYYVNMAEQLGEENSGRDTTNEKTTKRQYSFAGQNARTANSQTLAEAKAMDEAGAANETIRQQTGWFKGMDGKWRFEVDDSSSRISENVSNYMTLGELLQDAEILKAYPNMADVSVVFQSLPKGVNASYSPQFDTIDVSYSLKGDPEAIRAAVLHEVQHVIQRWEGFTTGTTVGSWDRKIKAGFDSRRGADIRKARETEQELRRVQQEEPEFYRDMMELDAMKPDGPRGEVDWDTLEQITEDPPEWQAFDARRDQLQEIYGDMKVWDFMDLLYQQEKAAKNEGRTATELYWDTAGEIEARDTAGRRNLTAEERKNKPPMLGGEDTVFADDTGISFDQEISDYPYDMQTVIQEYIDSVDENVLTFVDKVQNGQAWRGQKVTVGTANSRMVEDIARLTGVENAEDCKILMNSNAVEHIQKRHGANGEHDNTMRNNRDIARINFVLQNYDSMKLGHRISGEYKNRDGTKAKMVVLSKKINGTYFVIEAVPDTGKIGIVSAYMNRNGAPQVPDENAPSLNVHDELASAPNGIVPSENPTVKRQMSISQTVSRKNVADDLREILNRGGDAAELRRYVGQLEQGGRNVEQTGPNTYQRSSSAEQTEARRIVSMAKRYGISVEEYLRRNWEQYEVDGQWNEAARKALDMERGGRKYSLSGSTDNQGRQLSRGQAEYFKDSKARDENGNLVTVYHSSPTAGFYKFDGGKGDGNYKYGAYDETVTFFTDSKHMADSYAPTNKPVDTRRRSKAADALHNLKRSVNAARGKDTSGQYEGYVNITKPYVVDAEGRAWSEVRTVLKPEMYEHIRSLTSEDKKMLTELAKHGYSVIPKLAMRVTKSGVTDVSDEFVNKAADSIGITAEVLLNRMGSIMREVGTDVSTAELCRMAESGFSDVTVRTVCSDKISTNGIVREAINKGGYDGVIIRNVVDYGAHRGEDSSTPGNLYITFSPEQFKAWDNTEPTRSKDIRYSDRDIEPVSNRSLLANAFESVAQNDIERQKIQEYKSKIDRINAEERRLHELRTQIKEMSFAKGPRDTKKIRDLQLEANQTANRISTYDKQLLRLEASLPLQNVLNREKEMARKRAEQKGKEALEAYREKATKAQRELLEKWQTSRKKGIDSRRRTAMRHKIKDVVNELNRYLLNGTKDRHVPIGLQKAVAEALNAVNMDTVGAEERIAKLNEELLKAKTPEAIRDISKRIDNIREMGDRMDERLKKLKAAYDEFINSDDPLIANSHDDAVSAHMMRLIVRVGDTPLRDMTVDQLQDVYDVYKVVLATIRNANKSFKDNKNREISTRANQVMAEIDALGVKRGKRIAGFEWIEKFGWDGLKPVYAMEHIGSSGLIEAYNNVRAGEDTWAEDVMEAREYYLEQFRKYGYDSWDFEKKRRFTSTTGKDFELTLDQIMSLYAYSKRDQAADHLKYGGIVFDPKTEVVEKTKHGIKVKYNVANATAYNISEETLADIISKLTPEQKGFVDEMQTYLSDVMGAKGNEVSLAMYDVKLFREKYYFPLKSAHQYMAKAKEQAQGDVKIKNSGFSKETKPHAKNPIVLSSFMDVWTSHVNEMSMYHAFVLPMEDFYRIYNYTTPSKDENLPTEGVNAYIENAYGSGATAYIEQMLKDLNGGARADSRTGLINKMMGLFKKGAVFASLSVVVQQPSAIARAAALVDTKYFIGPKVDHKRHKALWDEVKRYAPVAIIKEMGYFDTNMGKSTQDFIMGKEYFGFSEKMKALLTDSNYRDEILSKAPALADEIAWCSIWEAVKRETRAKNPGMDVTSETFLKKAGERFTEVITKTQVYDSILSRSALMRSKDTGMKMATAFMAEPTTSINMVADALLKGKRGDRKYARTAIGAVVASQILNSILVSFVYAGRDDDEDETYLEKYIGTLTGEILDSLNPAGYIPFIKDIVSIVRGYDVERSDMAVVSDLWNAWQSLSKDNVSVYRKVEGFAGSIAQIFGLPVKNIMRDARGIYQTVMSFVNGQHTTKAGIAYAVKGAITGQTVSDQQQLYEAIISGDKVQISRVKSRFKDQSAINTAIRKALRENDPRIKEAASAKFNGDLDEYLRIAKEIIAEKHFVQDDVVAAINAEINALSKDETTPSAQKASGMFKTEDFALAIAQSDSALANAIKTDIIQTAQKNGKSAEEAEKNFNSGAKSELKEMFLAGALAENATVKALVSFCGDEQEEAEERVEEWAFQKEYGFAYDDHGDAYMNGEISAHELKAILMDMGGKAEEEADLQIQAYDWEVQGFEGATVAAVRDYNEHCAAFDVPKDAYLHIRKFSSNTENDLDEATGKTIYYSAMKKVMAEIHAQTGLTAAQKDAIARSLGWSEKNIQKYKLW